MTYLGEYDSTGLETFDINTQCSDFCAFRQRNLTTDGIHFVY